MRAATYRHALRLGVVVLAVTLATTSMIPPVADAASGGAGATGRGDEIITSILAARRRSGSPPGTGTGSTPPRCVTHVLTDRQITYLLHVAANMPELLQPSFLNAIHRYANTSLVATVATPDPTTTVAAETTTTGPDASPDDATTTIRTEPTTTLPVTTTPEVTYFDLTVRLCDGVARTMSVRSRTVTGEVLGASAIAGDHLRHSTRLPAPVVHMSPPPRTGPSGVISATIVGEPVFFSVSPPPKVADSIGFGGRIVDVEAMADHIEIFSGEPASNHVMVECPGFGVPYDPSSELAPATQAAAPGACVVVFDQRTGAPRRNAWYGYVALQWKGRYRVDGGPWRPLDGLFSTAVFAVSVGEVDTVIGN